MSDEATPDAARTPPPPALPGPDDDDRVPDALVELQAGVEMAQLPLLDVLANLKRGVDQLNALEASLTYHLVLVPDDGPPVYRHADTFAGMLGILADSVKEYRHVYPFRGRRLGVSRNGRWLVDGDRRVEIPAGEHDDGNDVDPDGVLDMTHGRKELIAVGDDQGGDVEADEFADADQDDGEAIDI